MAMSIAYRHHMYAGSFSFSYFIPNKSVQLLLEDWRPIMKRIVSILLVVILVIAQLAKVSYMAKFGLRINSTP